MVLLFDWDIGTAMDGRYIGDGHDKSAPTVRPDYVVHLHGYANQLYNMRESADQS